VGQFSVGVNTGIQSEIINGLGSGQITNKISL